MPLKSRLLQKICLPVALLCFLAGCVPAVDMSKGSWAPSGEQTGRNMIIGSIDIKRPAAHGGNDLSAIGKIRGGFGNPFTVKAKAGKELDAIMRKSADAALQNAGFSTTATNTGDTNPSMEIDVLDFWCDGYMAYTIKAIIEVRIVQSGTVIASKTIETSQGFFLNMGYSPMHDAYREVANRLTLGIADFLQSDETQRALLAGETRRS